MDDHLAARSKAALPPPPSVAPPVHKPQCPWIPAPRRVQRPLNEHYGRCLPSIALLTSSLPATIVAAALDTSLHRCSLPSSRCGCSTSHPTAAVALQPLNLRCWLTFSQRLPRPFRVRLPPRIGLAGCCWVKILRPEDARADTLILLDKQEQS